MTKKYKRHFLKDKEAKMLLEKASEKLKMVLEKIFNGMPKVEVINADFGEVYLLNGEPALFKSGENIYPTLLFNGVHGLLPKVVVDMGAIPHVCNGADIMAPGIVRFEGKFVKGDVVLVADERYGKPIAVGEILYNSDEVIEVKHGVVVRNVHYVGDKIWKTLKKLAGA
jgi:PUA domain protein